MTKKRTTALQTATAAQLTTIETIRAEIAGNGSGNKTTVRKAPGGFITLTEYDATDGTRVAIDIYPSGIVTDPRNV